MTNRQPTPVDRRGKTLLHRFFYSRPHLALAIAFGTVIALLLPDTLELMTRALISWNAAVWGYLITMMRLITRADHRKVREIADKQDEKAPLVLITLIVASIASLCAIFFELSQLSDAKGWERTAHYLLTGATLIGSWLLVGLLFCFHYAHMYYRAPPNALPFKFPDGEKEPDYWDFLYFSFTIAVAVQTSDIAVMGRGMRKVVLAHSVLNFFFNLAILGLSVNIAAGLVHS